MADEQKVQPDQMSVTTPSGKRMGGIRARRPIPVRQLAFMSALGPGIIAAMAGDDAGGVATYSSAGAEYKYALLWVLIILTISLALIQDLAGRMGAVTGKGFADLVRERFGVRATAFVMASLVVANTGLIISDFAGIGASAELFGISRYIAIPLAALALWYLVTRGSYRRVERIFLVMTLAFVAYPIAAFLAKPDWNEVGSAIVHPTIHTDARYLTLVIALVGTTLTPYMQVFIQSAVAERGAGNQRETRIDAATGALLADLVAGFIIIATGATLYVAGVKISSAADAAQALEPLAGKYSSLVFGMGLFGASMLAAAVLPLATAYSVTEAFGFEKGVSRTFREAPIFIGLVTILMTIGAVVAMLPGIDVFKLLVTTQVINGLLLPVVLVSLLLLARDRDIMGEYVSGPIHSAVCWATAILVTAMSTIYLGILVLGFFGIEIG